MRGRIFRLWRDLSASGEIYPPLARFIRLWQDLAKILQIFADYLFNNFLDLVGGATSI
jgi:hypothetical protein